MIRRVLGAVVLGAMALVSGCSTLGGYPSQWHSASDSIHVYVSQPERMVEIPAGGQVLSLLDAVVGFGQAGCDLSRVVVFRRSGSGTTRLDVDVLDMIRTGNNAKNILLQPGDVVGIAG